MNDVGVRYNVYLLRSLISGILYAAFNSFAAILYNSRWFLSVAVYYILLAITRYILFISAKRHERLSGHTRLLYASCRRVGVVMLLLNIAMATIIVYTISTERVSSHSPLVVYLLGVYTVSIVAFNVASLVVHRRQRLAFSYLVARIISLCASFTSVFNLANSIAVAIPSHTASKIIRYGVGGAVIFLVLTLSVTVIVKSNRRMRACDGKESFLSQNPRFFIE